MKLHIGFFSTVHPHPWNPQKGTFNAAMLRGLRSHAEISAVVPVPWPERIKGRAGVWQQPGYQVEFPLFVYLPRFAPLALASQLSLSTRSALGRLPVPDVILSYWTDPDGTAAVQWGSRINRPVALMVGGSDVLVVANDKARKRRMLNTLSRASAVLTIGPRIRDRLIEWGLDEKVVTVFKRGVDRTIFFPQDQAACRTMKGLPLDRHILVWIGRMEPVKGLKIAIDALGHSPLAELNPLLILIGDGSLRPDLESQARAAGLSDSVIFPGAVPHAELGTWINAANLVILPSFSEGVPNVLLEASACKVPFVSSDVGSISDLTESPELTLVPPGDAGKLAAAIARNLLAPPTESAPVPDASESAAMLAATLSGLSASNTPESAG